MAGKFYAVRVGRTPGIYLSWDECKKNVDGFSGPVYKSFKTRAEAEEFMGRTGGSACTISGACITPSTTVDEGGCIAGNEQAVDKSSAAMALDTLPYAFVDGSYNIAAKVYGYGGNLRDERLSGDDLAENDDLREVPLCEVGGRLLFHALGPVSWKANNSTRRTRNPYSDYGYY